MANEKTNERIVLGSGLLYITEFDGEIPESTVIETEANLLGYIKNGATLTYTPTFYDATDDLGKVAKRIITEEEAVLSSGVMTWNANTLAALSATARVTEDTTEGKRTMKIGGVGNYDRKKYLLRFLYSDPADGDIRVTIVGSNQAGFALAFVKDQETVTNAEFKALPQDADGTLILYEEDAPEIKTGA